MGESTREAAAENAAGPGESGAAGPSDPGAVGRKGGTVAGHCRDDTGPVSPPATAGEPTIASELRGKCKGVE